MSSRLRRLVHQHHGFCHQDLIGEPTRIRYHCDSSFDLSTLVFNRRVSPFLAWSCCRQRSQHPYKGPIPFQVCWSASLIILANKGFGVKLSQVHEECQLPWGPNMCDDSPKAFLMSRTQASRTQSSIRWLVCAKDNFRNTPMIVQFISNCFIKPI